MKRHVTVGTWLNFTTIIISIINILGKLLIGCLWFTKWRLLKDRICKMMLAPRQTQNFIKVVPFHNFCTRALGFFWWWFSSCNESMFVSNLWIVWYNAKKRSKAIKYDGCFIFLDKFENSILEVLDLLEGAISKTNNVWS